MKVAIYFFVKEYANYSAIIQGSFYKNMIEVYNKINKLIINTQNLTTDNLLNEFSDFITWMYQSTNTKTVLGFNNSKSVCKDLMFLLTKYRFENELKKTKYNIKKEYDKDVDTYKYIEASIINCYNYLFENMKKEYNSIPFYLCFNK